MRSSKHCRPSFPSPAKARRKLFKATLLAVAESLEARRLLSAMPFVGLDNLLVDEQPSGGAAAEQSSENIAPGATGCQTAAISDNSAKPAVLSSAAHVLAATTDFSNLSISSSIAQGTASVAFGGTIAAGVSIPPSTESVAITLNGVTHHAPIAGNGTFSTMFNTSALPASNAPYQIVYVYSGDANFKPVTDNTTTTLVVMPLNGTSVSVFRLFSPVTKEHLYTADLNEYDTLGTEGWNQEGVAYLEYNGLVTIGNVTTEPLYRLYDIANQQHLWTTDANEYNTLKDFVGTWSVDGIAGYVFPSAVPGSTPLYRMSYPFATDLHLWTTDANEYNTLAAQYGWNKEGIIAYVALPGPLSQIIVGPSGATVQYGNGPLQLTATPKDANGNTISLPAGDSLTWTSSNPAVATVDNTGKVTALTPGGSVTITVTDKATGIISVPVTVTAYGQVVRIVLTIADPEIDVGEVTVVVAAAYDSVGHPLTLAPGRIQFSSNNTLVATVDSNGNITGQGSGIATITARDSVTGISGAAAVTVNSTPYNDYNDYTDVGYSDYSDTPYADTPYSDYTDVPYSDHSDIPYSDHTDVPYSDYNDVPYSDYDDVPYSDYSDAPYADYSDFAAAPASLDNIAAAAAPAHTPQDGHNAAIMPGGVDLFDVSTIVPIPDGAMTLTDASVLDHITVQPDGAAINEGQRLQLMAIPRDNNDNALTSAAGDSLNWNSSDTSVATIDSATGLLSGVAPGTVQVTVTSAKHPGSAKSVTVTVAGVLDHLALLPDGGSVQAGQTLQLTATPQDKINNTVTLAAWDCLHWNSDNTAVATVNAATGLVTGISVGRAKITVADAHDPSVTRSVLVTVTAAALLDGLLTSNAKARERGRHARAINAACSTGLLGATPWL